MHYPFASHYLDVDGLKLHYLDEGQGDPVVMVHGNPSWSFYYRNLVLALRATHRCIVPDHIGMGLSDKPDDAYYAYRLEQRIEDLEALLDRLDVRDNITLVVHDWGGAIGMGYATRHPERIRRLVILNTAAFHLPRAKAFPFALRLVRTPLGALLVRGFNAFSRGAARVGCKRHPLSAELKALYCLPYDSWANRIATLRFVEDIPLEPGHPSYAGLSAIQERLDAFRNTPALIAWGMRDFVFSREFLDEWRRYLPEAEVHRFEDCGHYILEDATEEVVALVQRFLSGDSTHPTEAGDG